MRLKQLYIVCCSILFVYACNSSQPEIGIGVIHFENDFSTKLDFYDEPDLALEPIFYVNLRYDAARASIRTSLDEYDSIAFNPFYAITRSSLVTLQVMEQRDGWFKVITDDILGVSHWLSAPDQPLESWRDFLFSIHRIRPYDRNQNPLRKGPSENAQSLAVNPDFTCLEVIDIQGGWIKVRNMPDKCPDDAVSEEPVEGFIRWKKGNQILISFRL